MRTIKTGEDVCDLSVKLGLFMPIAKSKTFKGKLSEVILN